MARKEKYLLVCLYAVNRLIERGNSAYGVKVDGRWEIIPLNAAGKLPAS